MKKVEEKNIQWAMDNYGIGLENGQYVLGVDHHEELNGADLVVYCVDELNDVWSADDLRRYCDKSGGEEESYEVERVTLVRIDDF